MTSRRVWAGLGILVVVMLAVWFWSGGQTLPRPARHAIQQRYPDAKVIQAKPRTVGGKTEYSVALWSNSRRADVRLTADGQLKRGVRDIAPRDLPQVVANAIAAKYPGSTVRWSEEVSKAVDGKNTVVLYEVLLATAEKREIEARVTPDGEVTPR